MASDEKGTQAGAVKGQLYIDESFEKVTGLDPKHFRRLTDPDRLFPSLGHTPPVSPVPAKYRIKLPIYD